MRPLPLILLLAALANFAETAEPSPAPTWPLWDGAESVEQYSKRAGLEPTKSLDLGNGVKLEMVLIPAGKFTMGTPEPESVWIGRTVLAAGGLAALVMIAVLLVRAIRQRRRPQFSLRWLILLVAVLGVAQYGGIRWWRALDAWYNFRSDEGPAHEVTISTPYYMGKCEVTQEQYRQVTGTNPSQFKGRDLPVECVSWDEAQEFCKKATRTPGFQPAPGEGKMAAVHLAVRLPTEAEWEYACRAGTTTRFCSGDADADLESVAWCGWNSGDTTHSVGQKAPNSWGLHDMHGNVWEWCQDLYEPYKAEPVVDPQGPAQGADRVSRGGSWIFAPRVCRSAIRLRNDPEARDYHIGFRVTASVPSKAP
jgi:formylglycine-generating enzyme required for sulfatase activity